MYTMVIKACHLNCIISWCLVEEEDALLQSYVLYSDKRRGDRDQKPNPELHLNLSS